jgi:hypothetical protein
MDLKTRYKIKGLGTEKTIESVIKIFTDEKGEKITQVEDRWNGNIPDGAFAKVGISQLITPFWWINACGIIEFWIFCSLCWVKPWEVSRWGEASFYRFTSPAIYNPWYLQDVNGEINAGIPEPQLGSCPNDGLCS